MTGFALNIGHNLVLMLGLVLAVFLLRREMPHVKWLGQVTLGLIFGIVAVYCMSSAFVYKPGIIFDCRTIVVMLGAMFGGAVVGSIASIIAIIYRIMISGPGAVTGVSTILIACASGLAGRYILKRYHWPPEPRQVLLVGFLGHALVLACLFLLPESIRWEMTGSLLIPFLIIYPLVFLALGMIIVREDVWLSKMSRLDHVDRLFTEAQRLTRFGSWEYLPETNQLLATPNFLSLLDLEDQAEELTPEQLFSLINDDDREKFADTFKRAVSSGVEFDIEGRITTRKNRKLWIRLAAKLVSSGYEQSRLVGNLFDISWRKSNELELRASQDRLQAILDHTLSLICICDTEGKVTLANRRFKVFGMNSEDLIGRQLFEFLPRAGALERWIDDYNVLMTGGRVEFEEVLWHADGSVHTYLTSKFLLAPISDRPESICYVASDITDLRRTMAERKLLADELKVKNDELERFAYTVSHDLKGPLLTIKSYSNLLDEEQTTDVSLKSEFLQHIRDAADKMSHMIEGLLELSKVGRALGEPAMVDLGRVIDDAVLLLDGERRKSNARITISPGLPAVKGDYLRILQVMQNLLQNAFKYASCERRLEINIRSEEEPDEGVLVTVSDNGLGLDVDQSEKIFDLFVQGHDSGSGVGLALVKRIMEVHGGEVWVESSGRDQGCTFFLRFPPLTDLDADDLSTVP